MTRNNLLISAAAVAILTAGGIGFYYGHVVPTRARNAMMLSETASMRATAQREWDDAQPLTIPIANARDVEKIGAQMGLSDAAIERAKKTLAERPGYFGIVAFETAGHPDAGQALEIVAGGIRAVVPLDAATSKLETPTDRTLRQRIEDRVTRALDGTLKGRRILVPRSETISIRVATNGIGGSVRPVINGAPGPYLSKTDILEIKVKP
jgi:hypothetical protein